MKKFIVSLTLGIFLICSSSTYANTLNINQALDRAEKGSYVKALEHMIIRQNNLYTKIVEIGDKIPLDVQRKITEDLSQPVQLGKPKLISIFGMPYLLDHTLGADEINVTLAMFGFATGGANKLNQDRLLFINPAKILSGYNILTKNKQALKNEMRLNTEQLYYGIILKDKAIELQEEMIQIDQQKFKNDTVKFQKGLISQNDYKISKIKNEQNKLKLNIEKRSKENMLYTLNKLIGADINEKYESLEGKIKQISRPNVTLETAINKAFTSRTDIYAQEEEIKNCEREFLFMKIHYKNYDTEYKIAELNLDLAKEKLENIKEDIKYELESQYENIDKNQNDIDTAQIKLDNANMIYKDMESKYSAGLITEDILDLCSIQVKAAELELLSAINTYNFSVKKLNGLINIGPVLK